MLKAVSKKIASIGNFYLSLPGYVLHTITVKGSRMLVFMFDPELSFL
jgi:hypothetical protein